MKLVCESIKIKNQNKKSNMKNLVCESIHSFKQEPPIKQMGLSMQFEDDYDAAEYVKDNLKKITGFDDFVLDPKDEEMLHPRLIKKIQSWYNKYADRIEDTDEEDFWEYMSDQ